jgi:cytochrome bd-type quinol oxidase subunit 2
MDRRRLSLLAAIGLAAVGLVATFLLQDHFVGDFTASLNVVPRSYRAWRDPAALLLGFAAIAAAVWIAVARTQRVALALAVVGCTLAAAVYVHQQAVHTFVCPPGYHCPAIMFRPDIWHDSRSLLIMAVGFAAAIVLVIQIRWRVAPLLHSRRG